VSLPAADPPGPARAGRAAAEVRLRRYRPGDAAALAQAARESWQEIGPWMAWCHAGFSEAEAAAWIAHTEVAWRHRTELDVCIVDGEDAILGACGVNQLHEEHRFANLGYWVRTSATGRGVAPAAVRQLVELVRRETDLVRLEIVVAAGNRRSARVAEKAGARFEGRLSTRLWIHGVAHDADLYALVIDREEGAAAPS
jgi:RimJ/RimL family protein N-acetyltransferase